MDVDLIAQSIERTDGLQRLGLELWRAHFTLFQFERFAQFY